MSRYVTYVIVRYKKLKYLTTCKLVPISLRSYVALCLLTLCHLMSRYVTLRYKKLKYLTTCKLVPISLRSYVALCLLMSPYVTLCHVMSLSDIKS